MIANWLHHGMSLRRRILLLTLLTSGIGLLVACGAYLVFEGHDGRVRAVQELESTADLIGTNAEAALAFDDGENGERLLQALRTRPHIRGTALYGADGRLFASYQRSGVANLEQPASSPPESVEWASAKLVVTRNIVTDGKIVGRIRIESD